MRVTLVADGRSPITRRWLRSAASAGVQFDLISSFPCEKPPEVRGFIVIPLAFSSLAVSKGHSPGLAPAWVKRFRPPLQRLRAWLGPLTIRRCKSAFLQALHQFQPDVVHALRIPYEGMLASFTPQHIPFSLSIWGNDLTLHARSSPLLAAATRRALARADGILADADRDLNLALAWGFHADNPRLNVPGNGGIDFEEIDALLADLPPAPDWLPGDRIFILNPRGIRPAYVLQDTFFASASIAVQKMPKIFFLCAAMQGQPQAEAWLKEYHLEEHARLLPLMDQRELWALAARCRASVSLAIHDGTPNTLLESMACGCLPIAGDIASLREWIRPEANGLLVDPYNPAGVAQAILRAADDVNLWEKARLQNRVELQKRADFHSVGEKILKFFVNLKRQ